MIKMKLKMRPIQRGRMNSSEGRAGNHLQGRAHLFSLTGDFFPGIRPGLNLGL